MATRCGARGCALTVPAALETDSLCILHFAQMVEDACNELRRESARGLSTARREQIAGTIAQYGLRLISISTGGEKLADETKMRLLSTFLALMNLRESVDRTLAAAQSKKF